jgi:urease accessory protein
MSYFMAGIAHPINGADHILAMVAVGLWGAAVGGRALWAWPAAFVTMVVAGFTSAILGLQLPLVEPAIVCSIVILGLLIAFAVKAPIWAGALIVGLFAVFHGHAHGTEALTAGMEPMPYAAGFSLATAALHVLGLGAGLIVARSVGLSLLRATGGVVALGGLALIVAVA